MFVYMVRTFILVFPKVKVQQYAYPRRYGAHSDVHIHGNTFLLKPAKQIQIILTIKNNSKYEYMIIHLIASLFTYNLMSIITFSNETNIMFNLICVYIYIYIYMYKCVE